MKESTFEFAAEGVKVVVPDQARNLRVVRRPVGSLAEMKPQAGGFNPWRLVFNFEMEDEDQPGTYVSQFDAPLELRVRYSGSDIEQANKAGKSLRMGFWDGSKWVAFDKKKHNFQIIPDAGARPGGELVVIFSQWSDPPIGIGI